MAEHLSDWHRARRLYESLVEEPHPPESLRAQVLTRLAHSMWMLDELDEAESTYNEAISLMAIKTADSYILAQTLCDLAKVYQKTGRFPEARKKYNEALSYFEQVGDDKQITNVLQFLVQLNWLQCKFGQAAKLQTRVIDSLKGSDAVSELAEAYSKQGDIYRYVGELRSSLLAYSRSLELYSLYNERYLIGWVYNGISSVYRMQGQLESAFEYINRALEVFNAIDYRIGVAWGTYGLGEVYRQEGKFYLATGIYEDCVNLFEICRDKSGVGLTLNSLAEIYLATQRYNEAEKHFWKAIHILEGIDATYSAARGYRGLGAVFNNKGEYDKATKFVKKALILFREMQNLYQVRLCRSVIGTICARQGFHATAYRNMMSGLRAAIIQDDKFHEVVIRRELQKLELDSQDIKSWN